MSAPQAGPDEKREPGSLEAIFAGRVVRRESGEDRPAGPKARRTRQLILAAARTQFDRQGYQRTSMVDVALAAGVSQGTVYQYFRDRSDLVVAIIQQALHQLLTRTDTTWRPEEGMAGLERILSNYATGFAEAPDVVRVWEEVSHTDEDMAELRRSLGRLFEASVEKAIRTGQRAGRIRRGMDPVETSRALCAMTDRYCYVSYVFDPPVGGPPDPAETGRLLAELWAAALGIAD